MGCTAWCRLLTCSAVWFEIWGDSRPALQRTSAPAQLNSALGLAPDPSRADRTEAGEKLFGIFPRVVWGIAAG